jgi:uncharacterized protein YqgC (DUF456 family)
MHYVGIFVFSLFLVLCWGLTLFGLPGNWLIVIGSIFVAFSFGGMGVTTIMLLAGLALIGEIIELVAGAAGMKKGGSKRGAVMAVIGSFIGGIGGAAAGIPIPVLGSAVGVILGAALGAMFGAIIGEMSKGRGTGHSLEIGKAAFFGRLVGSAVKLAIGAAMILVAIAALVWMSP